MRENKTWRFMWIGRHSDFLFIYREIKSDISCESSVKHMKCQALFSQKKNQNVICCSCDKRFKGYLGCVKRDLTQQGWHWKSLYPRHIQSSTHVSDSSYNFRHTKALSSYAIIRPSSACSSAQLDQDIQNRKTPVECIGKHQMSWSSYIDAQGGLDFG